MYSSLFSIYEINSTRVLQMHVVSGDVRVKGSIALVTQDAWVWPTTLRENVLMGLPYDEMKYEAIMSACGLNKDLAGLPYKDKTEIGEKGATLR